MDCEARRGSWLFEVLGDLLGLGATRGLEVQRIVLEGCYWVPVGKMAV